MLTQTELNQKFPNDLPDTRYCVGWYNDLIKDNLREVIVVFDKVTKHIVYKGISKNHKDHYPYIKLYYGRDNCDPPKQINPDFYAGY